MPIINSGSQPSSHPITADLASNLRWIQSSLGDSPDLVIRTFSDDETGITRAAFLYIEGLVDQKVINQMILQPFMLEWGQHKTEELTSTEWLEMIKNKVLSVGNVAELLTMEETLAKVLAGNTLVILQECSIIMAAETSGGEKRSVEEPSTQTVIRGPKESFVENLSTNISLIRRRIKSPQFRIDMKNIGRQTQTRVALIYLKGIAKDSVIEEAHKRLDRIDTDSILESGYIEEFIEDASSSPLPTLQNTERPDAAAAALLEGQIVIIVDGTPFVLIAPVTFIKFFQSSEDYYQHYDIATFLRIIRYVAFFVSMLLPALYIAITTFHQEMLPTPLLVSLAAQREGVPFPAVFEALLMEITFEVLREAGVRMPRVIGPAISIVGALVLGQAAVQAGLVSGSMVIVVSFTAIASFVIPAMNVAIAARLIRFVMMILGGTLGLFGIMSGLMILLIHMASLRSFGVSYLTTLSPFVGSNWKDVFIRVPWWAMKKRPSFISNPNNQVRQSGGQKPSPPDEKEETRGPNR